MVKFENRVVLNKISYFLESAPLIVIFHCQNRNYFRKKLNKNYTNKEQSNLFSLPVDCKKNKFTSPFIFSSEKAAYSPSASGDSTTSSRSFIVKSLKNNYVKKVLQKEPIFSWSHNRLSAWSKNSISLSDKTLVARVNPRFTSPARAGIEKVHITSPVPKIKNYKKDDKLPLKKIEKPLSVLKNSLFKGNRLVIAFRNVSLLNRIKKIIEEENVYILGGIYENIIIDHNQVKRLIYNCDNNKPYFSLNTKLKERTVILLNRLKLHQKIVTVLHQIALKKASQDN